jgi:UDP-glucose 4-epimerase
MVQPEKKQFEGKRCLVTGGAGFIGTHLAQTLLAQGAFVRIVDNLSTGFIDNLRRTCELAEEDKLEVVLGDICDPGLVDSIAHDVDYVLHQAALGSVPRSMEDPLATHENNVTGTLRVLDGARKSDRVRRVVCASSSSVYGGATAQPPTLIPRSPYAASKACVEKYASAYSAAFGLSVVCLRYFNIFGPYQSPEGDYAAVIPRFFEAALSGRPLIVHGDGKQSRDFTHVDNAVSANLNALTSEEVPGDAVYDVGTGESHRVGTLARWIRDVTGSSSEIKHADARAGDVRRSVASIVTTRKDLGYDPVPFDVGLQRTYSYWAERFSQEKGRHGSSS